MIRIIFPETGLTPAITIKNTALTTVSSGVMTEIGPTNDGRFWYGYTYQGTPGLEYQISVDAGVAVEDPEIRYVNFWEFEDYTPADIETAIITDGDGNAVLQAIADKIGNQNVSAAAIASAVRTNLTTELGRIDQPISSLPSASTVAGAVRTELTLELSRIDAAISSISGGGGGGGGTSGGVGFYMTGGGGVDTKAIEKKFTDIMTEIKKEPEKYTKALQTAQAAIVDTVKKIPQPIVNVNAPDVKLDIPPEFLQEIKTIVKNFNDGAEGKIQATENAYTLILKRFRENIAEDIKNAVRNDQPSFDTVIESAILRATSEFTSALSHITLIEEE